MAKKATKVYFYGTGRRKNAVACVRLIPGTGKITINDKDIDGILHLLPHYAEYYFCKADIPRGLDANILAEKALEAGLRGNVYESVQQAYNSAVNNASFDDVVFIGGSNFTVAEVI